MAVAATEDTLHSLEQRYILLQRDHERVKKEKDDLQRRLTDATADAAQANAKVASLQQVGQSIAVCVLVGTGIIAEPCDLTLT